MHGNASRKNHSPTYKTWANMRKRCNTPSCVQYKYYGGKGITICQTWDDFAVFLADMGKRPDGMTLDRIDTTKGYSKTNCRWVNQTLQIRNRSNTRYVEALGQKMTIAEWVEKTGLTYNTILLRLKRGFTEHDAVTLPKRAW
jgi:hypothetical protein